MQIRKYFVFSILIAMAIFLNNQVFAEELSVIDECINNKLTLTILSSGNPVENASVYIYQDSSMKKFHDKLITNAQGQIEFQFSEKTVYAKITKDKHDDLIQSLSCIESFRPQSVSIFGVVDSSVGIIDDPVKQLTIVDLGTFYGLAGNGTIPDTVKILRDNHVWKTITKGTGISPSTSHSEWQIPQTVFYNELPGKYRIILITNGTETLVYEFEVRQITEYNKSNFEGNTTKNISENASKELSKYNVTPLKQMKNGVSPNDIICNSNLQLMFKITNDSPACVKPSTVEKLIERGWFFHGN